MKCPECGGKMCGGSYSSSDFFRMCNDCGYEVECTKEEAEGK